jgi:hypothetical protein
MSLSRSRKIRGKIMMCSCRKQPSWFELCGRISPASGSERHFSHKPKAEATLATARGGA